MAALAISWMADRQVTAQVSSHKSHLLAVQVLQYNQLSLRLEKHSTISVPAVDLHRLAR